MGEFMVCVANNVMAEHPASAWQRMVEYLDRRAAETELSWSGSEDRLRDWWVYKGDAPSDVVTVLIAAAEGHSLHDVIDLLELTRDGRSDS